MFRRMKWIVLLALAATGPASAESSDWRDDRFNIVVRDQNLRDVLQQFGSLAGVPVILSDAVDGTLSARFEGASGKDIVASIAREYGLDWRFDGRRIEVSSTSEQVSRILDMDGVTRDALIASLTDLGAYEPRFPISAQDGRLALLIGPPRYVGIVEIVLADLVEERRADRDRAMAMAAKREEREREERERQERARIAEDQRLRALLEAQLRQSETPVEVERETPLINRGGRWGG